MDLYGKRSTGRGWRPGPRRIRSHGRQSLGKFTEKNRQTNESDPRSCDSTYPEGENGTRDSRSLGGEDQATRSTQTLDPQDPSTSKKKSGGFKKAALSGATKGFLRSIGIDPKFINDDNESGGYTPKGAKGKQPKKAKKTETEKLTEGWEGWDNPTKRKLSYGKKQNQEDTKTSTRTRF